MGKRRRPARSSAPIVESAVYDGAILLGSVIGRTGTFRASSATGRKLGMFETPQAAMLAIVEAARSSADGGLA
jgi:hypothetical protein